MDATPPIEPPTLHPLLENPESIRVEARKRRSSSEAIRIHPADEDEFVGKGWTVEHRKKKATWLSRPKRFDVRLEDRVWTLLNRLGYPTLSGPAFKIRYQRPDGSYGTKQVDIFAKDDETVAIIECKARETRGRRSLQKDIHETENLQKPFGNAIRNYFGASFKPKVIWLYASENIIWSENDLERASAAGIRVITENELQYFETFAAHMGTAGRFQFLAEFLEGQEIPGLRDVRVPAFRGLLGSHIFYSFVVNARHLLKLSFVNHQALNHPGGRPAYQRMVSKSRIKEIASFVQNGGYFPTNILVNFTDTCRFDQIVSSRDLENTNCRFGWLYLPCKYKSAWIIDGQHRLYGFSDLPETYWDRDLFVLAFERMDTKTEAELFITINHEQRSVPKSLLVALQADLKLGSTDPKEAISALASSLVRALSSDPTSPLFGRFSVPGLPPDPKQNLTVAEAVNGLVRSGLLGRALPKRARMNGFFSGPTDKETIIRSRRVINGYLRLIMEANPARWEAGREGFVCVNPGLRAHLLLIEEGLKYLSSKGRLDPATDSPEALASNLGNLLAPVVAFFRDADAPSVEAKFARKFGEGGVREYFYGLCDLVASAHPDFGNDDFKKFRAHAADERSAQAARDLEDIQNAVALGVVETLKTVHGIHDTPSGEKAYWDLGIDNADIKQNAYKKQQSYPPARRSPREAYIDFIDFQKIIRQSNNWPNLEKLFNIPMPGEKGKKYYLDWMDRVNELRRIQAHKSPYRTFEEEDYNFVGWLKAELFSRMAQAGFDV